MQASNSSPLQHSVDSEWNEAKISPKYRIDNYEFADLQKIVSKKKSAPEDIPEMCLIAGKEASRYVKHFCKNSKLLQRSARTVDTLRWSDLEVGDLLGKGAFSHVYEVTLKEKATQSQPSATQSSTSRDLETSETSLDTSELFNESVAAPTSEVALYTSEEETKRRNAEFALKCIDPKYLKGKHDFSDSAIDIVLEAKLLSCLQHPNIIMLQAVTAGSVTKAFTRRKGFFLILERLQESLDQRMRSWTDSELLLSKMERMVRLENRLKMVVLEVAEGMQYLHENKVIYRDLKPCNVGFTSSDKVKLFDFGLAREIIDPLRRLTGYTGSARYMAPEVARSDFYGLPADVFSFAILTWEVCSLDIAFAGLSKQEHMEKVVGSHMRPKLGAMEGSSELKKLIQSCWSHDPSRRPSFAEIRDKLGSEVLQGRSRSPRVSARHSRRPRTQKQQLGGSTGSKLSMSLPSSFDIMF